MTDKTRLIVFFATLFLVGGTFIAIAFIYPKTAPWIALGYLLNYAVVLYRREFGGKSK